MDINTQRAKLIENLIRLSPVWDFARILSISIRAGEVPDSEIRELYEIVSEACVSELKDIETEKIQLLNLRVREIKVREKKSRDLETKNSLGLLLLV